ncbi:MAG TPA: type II toxin-antitoxin system VapC family toxin, partial [Leptospiraceae bacterium]|nr:type II toxin-antitoxin system VapC family toxin [Leptospiraceae bacterium]
LLDTHIFLWYINGNEKLKVEYRKIIEDFENTIFISAASLWEIIVKAKMGKLPLPAPYYDYIISQINIHSFS